MGGGGGGVAGNGGPLTGRPEHTYDVPFPPKQPSEAPQQRHCVEMSYAEECDVLHCAVQPAYFTPMSDTLSKWRISDEDSNPDEGENRVFEGNAATSENLEMSEAECDRDFQIYSKKGRNLSLVQYGKTRPLHAVSYVTYH
ncbi:hypothetical protein MRX96_028476 [Rhipicephalus microplus]